MKKIGEKVSIIVPVYNVEKYLCQCVESCVNQDYENIEVLLIDDGSTDKSGTICDELANRYTNVFSFHKTNGGLSDARNFGIERATGEYIMFVDSDDIISKDIVTILYQPFLNDNNCDLSVCGLLHFEDGKVPQFQITGGLRAVLMQDALIAFLYQKDFSPSACGKIYRRKVLSKNRFVKGQRFEDNEFVFNVIQQCKLVCIFDSNLYGYRHRNSSITTSSFSVKEYDILEIGKHILANTMKMDNRVKKAAVSYQCANALRILLTAPIEEYEDERYQYCRGYLKKESKSVIIDSNVRNKLRIGLIIYQLPFSISFLKYVRNDKNRWN